MRVFFTFWKESSPRMLVFITPYICSGKARRTESSQNHSVQWDKSTHSGFGLTVTVFGPNRTPLKNIFQKETVKAGNTFFDGESRMVKKPKRAWPAFSFCLYKDTNWLWGLESHGVSLTRASKLASSSGSSIDDPGGV